MLHALSFGLGERFWGREEVLYASDSLPDGLDTGSGPYSMTTYKVGIPKLCDAGQLERCWENIREEYSALDLTYPEKDRLVATSTIARNMGKEIGGGYIASHF